MNKKILWIEDQAEILSNIFSAIEKDGFTKDYVRTRKEFFAITNKMLKGYSIIVLDYAIPMGESIDRTPESICIEIIQHIREKMKLKTPIIVLTAYSSTFQNITRFIDIENLLLIPKPVFPEEVQEYIYQMIDRVDS